jgi:hypothetical protein
MEGALAGTVVPLPGEFDFMTEDLFLFFDGRSDFLQSLQSSRTLPAIDCQQRTDDNRFVGRDFKATKRVSAFICNRLAGSYQQAEDQQGEEFHRI